MTVSDVLDLLREILVPIAVAAGAALALARLQRSKRLSEWQLFAPARRVAKQTGAERLLAQVKSTLVELEPDASGATLWERLPAAREAEPLTLSKTTRAVCELRVPLQEPEAYGLIASLLHKERIAELRGQARAAIDAADSFQQLQPLATLRTKQLRFGAWVTRTVGAPILADPLDARARVASRVRVWSSSEYVGQGESSSSYAMVHDPECPAWAGRNHKAGDYDGRVAIVRSCTTLEDLTTGDLTFLIQTAESCYASTEEGHQPWGCKHIAKKPSNEPPDLAFLKSASPSAKGGIQPLLTSFATLMTSDKKLILSRRSKSVRSGPGVISATGGGVFEPGNSSDRRIDRDAAGWPDTAISVGRELEEELGLVIDGDALKPVCVFLANSRNPWSNDEGQLVVCTLYLGRVELTFAEVEAAVWSRADLAKGRYEVEGLVPIDLATIQSFTQDLEPRVGELDQHALLSCIYSARLLWGDDVAMEELGRLLAGRAMPELVADPGLLLPDRYDRMA